MFHSILLDLDLGAPQSWQVKFADFDVTFEQDSAQRHMTNPLYSFGKEGNEEHLRFRRCFFITEIAEYEERGRATHGHWENLYFLEWDKLSGEGELGRLIFQKTKLCGGAFWYI